MEYLFTQFTEFLAANGYAAKQGQIVDASIVAAPRQRNSREENRQIKEGQTPEDWQDAKNGKKMLMLAGPKRTVKPTMAIRTMWILMSSTSSFGTMR